VGFSPAGDCLATLRAVRALGVEIEELAPTTLLVRGRGLHSLQEPADVLDCSRSGTAMRLLVGVLAPQPFLCVLTGDRQLCQRPMARVVDPLRLMGATVLGRGGGRYPPLAVQGGQLRGIEYTLPVASAQVKSALLLAGLYANGPTTLREPSLSRDHTERMLLAMSARLHTRNGELVLEPGGQLQALEITVPGDFSSAAYLAVAATLVQGSEVAIEGVGVNATRIGLLDLLRAMGADATLENERIVSGEPVADLVVRSASLCGVEVGGEIVVRMIDEFPVLAVAATQAQGETVVRDAAELRVKETDRIATVTTELRRLGADIEPRPDGFRVRGPTRLKGTAVHSHSDHRLAMALTVAGLVAQGETTVHDVECVPDSFPGFEATLSLLGGDIR
jgi:3-phosphoshikimate 1-carboxyvinyltransferase